MTTTSLSGLDARDMADLLRAMQRFEPALRGARILVTGATGWFGTWLLDALVAFDRERSLGLSIVAVSRDPAAFARRHPALHAAPAIHWLRRDVRESLADVPGSFTHVIHAATDSSAVIGADGPMRLFETIVTGTRNVLERAACESAPPRVLLVSSGAVYGTQPPHLARLAETQGGAPDPLDPAAVYAEGKRAAELLGALCHATHGVPVTIARCFAFVGPHMPFDAHFAIGNFIRDALAGGTIHVGGDGRPRRTYLYMGDLVIWLLTVLVEGAPLRAYNVGAAEVVTIAALAERCAAASGRAGDVRIAGGGHGHDYVPDVGRAQTELGLSVRVSLDDAIERTMRWKAATSGGVPSAVACH